MTTLSIRAVLTAAMVCCAAFASAGTIVSGKITGAGGVPLAAANLVVCTPPDALPVTAVEAGRDGSYLATIETPGIWILRFTGVLHQSRDVALYIGQQKNVTLNVELGPYRYLPKFDGVKVNGNFNRWYILSAAAMQKQPDSIYTADIPASTDSVEYQLMYVRSGDAIEGTAADRYIPDGTGKYKSVVATVDGKAHIVFDPRKLAPPGRAGKIAFDNTDPVVSAFAFNYDEYLNSQEEFAGTFQSHIRTEKDIRSFAIDRSAAEEAIDRKIQDEKNETLKKELLLFRLSLAVADKKNDTSLCRRALDGITPASLVWLLNPHIVFQALNGAGYSTSQREEYVRHIISENPAARVVSAVLFDEYHVAKYTGQSALSARYFDLVTTRYAWTPEAVRLKKSYPHEIDVMIGKPAPDFSVRALNDSTKVFDKNSFAGKYLLLDFWAASIGPVKNELNALNAAYFKYREKNFQILSLSVDSTSQAISTLRKGKWKMPWLHAFLGNSVDTPVLREFGVTTVPSLFLIGLDGTLLAMGDDLRGAALETTLKKFLEGK